MATVSETFGLIYNDTTGQWEYLMGGPVPPETLARMGVKNGDPTDPNLANASTSRAAAIGATPASGQVPTNPRATPAEGAPAPTAPRDGTSTSTGAPAWNEGAYLIKIPTGRYSLPEYDMNGNPVEGTGGQEQFDYAWYYPVLGQIAYRKTDEYGAVTDVWDTYDAASAKANKVDAAPPGVTVEQPADAPFGYGGNTTPAPPRDTGPILPGGGGGDLPEPPGGPTDPPPGPPPPVPPEDTGDPTEDPGDPPPTQDEDIVAEEGPLAIAPPDPMDSDILDAIRWARQQAMARLGYRQTFVNGPRGLGGPSYAEWNAQLAQSGGLAGRLGQGEAPSDAPAMRAGDQMYAGGPNFDEATGERGGGMLAVPGDPMYAGGTPNFDEATGRRIGGETITSLYGRPDDVAYTDSGPTPKDLADEKVQPKDWAIPSAQPEGPFPHLGAGSAPGGGATTPASQTPAPGSVIERLYPNRALRKQETFDRGLAYW